MGMRFTPKGYGGNRRDPEQVKRDGWHEQHMLAVSLDDHRLTWPERELVRQLGENKDSHKTYDGQCSLHNHKGHN